LSNKGTRLSASKEVNETTIKTHLTRGFETSVGDLSDRDLLVVGLVGREDWRVRDEREVDPRVGHQVCLKLVEVNVEGAVKTERSRDGGDDLQRVNSVSTWLQN